MISEHVGDPLRPAPDMDGMGFIWLRNSGNKYIFGCASLNALADWFDGYLYEALNDGFFVREFEVPVYDVIDGYHQVAFYRPSTFVTVL